MDLQRLTLVVDRRIYTFLKFFLGFHRFLVKLLRTSKDLHRSELVYVLEQEKGLFMYLPVF